MVSSRGRNHGAWWRSSRLVLFLAAMLVTATAGAFTTTPNTYNYHGSRLGGVNGLTPGGVPTYATFRVSETGKPSTYVGKAFPTSFGTLGKLAKNAAKGVGYSLALQLVVEGIIHGAGWAISELRDQITEGALPSEQVAPQGIYYECNAISGDIVRYSSLAGARTLCVAKSLTYVGAALDEVVWTETQGNYHMFRVAYHRPGEAAYFRELNAFVVEKVNTGSAFATDSLLGRILTDEEVGQAVARHPEAVDALLTQDGTVIRTPELIQAMNELTDALAEKKGVEAPAHAEPKPDFAEKPEPTEKEWPGFCDWAKPICDFMDWVKTDEEVADEKLPEDKWDGEEVKWGSGIASDGACPAASPVTVSIAGHSTSVTFPYEPICNLARMVRPVFILIGLLIGAHIIGRGMTS